MAVNILLIFLYLLGCIHHTFLGVYSHIGLDFTNVTDEKLLDLKYNSYRYLTTWNFVFQTLYFYLAIIIELIPLCTIMSRISPTAKVIKGSFFSSIIFPAGICVASIFWIFHTIKKDFVLPPGYETVMPSWVNQSIHTIILYLIIVELALGELYVPRLLPTIIISFLLTVVYTIQYLALYYETGRWLYGICYYLNYTGIGVLLTSVNLYFGLLSFIGILIVRRKSNKYVLTEQDKKRLLCVRKFH